MTKTVAGRVALADSLVEQGLVDARAYLMVVETGTLDEVLDAPRQQVLLIKSENDKLLEGETPVAIVFDRHMEHIQEHAGLLGSTEARSDPGLVERVLAHIDQHRVLIETADPFYLSITNQQPPAPVEAPVEAPQMAGGGEVV